MMEDKLIDENRHRIADDSERLDLVWQRKVAWEEKLDRERLRRRMKRKRAQCDDGSPQLKRHKLSSEATSQRVRVNRQLFQTASTSRVKHPQPITKRLRNRYVYVYPDDGSDYEPESSPEPCEEEFDTRLRNSRARARRRPKPRSDSIHETYGHHKKVKNQTGYRGVRFNGNRDTFRIQMVIDQKRYHVGYNSFQTKTLAEAGATFDALYVYFTNGKGTRTKLNFPGWWRVNDEDLIVPTSDKIKRILCMNPTPLSDQGHALKVNYTDLKTQEKYIFYVLQGCPASAAKAQHVPPIPRHLSSLGRRRLPLSARAQDKPAPRRLPLGARAEDKTPLVTARRLPLLTLEEDKPARRNSSPPLYPRTMGRTEQAKTSPLNYQRRPACRPMVVPRHRLVQ